MHGTGGGQPQTPPWQTSTVQAFPSLQVLLSLFVCVQLPVVGSHASSVQELPSSQATGVCWHPADEPVAMRIVPVVLPDIPPTWPPEAPMKSIR